MRRRTGRRWLTLAPEPQIDQHRIVIGAAELVGGVQRGLQAGALEVDVQFQLSAFFCNSWCKFHIIIGHIHIFCTIIVVFNSPAEILCLELITF